MGCTLASLCVPLDLEISDPTIFDVPDFENLLNDIFNEYGLHGVVRWYASNPETILSSLFPERGVAHLLRARDESLIGAGVLLEQHDGGPDCGEIGHLYLRPEWRGRGLGRAFLDDLVSHAREIGFRSIYLVTRPELKEALRLYAAAGFIRVGNARYPDAPDLIELTLPLL